jgi:hypothetical protein
VNCQCGSCQDRDRKEYLPPFANEHLNCSFKSHFQIANQFYMNRPKRKKKMMQKIQRLNIVCLFKALTKEKYLHSSIELDDPRYWSTGSLDISPPHQMTMMLRGNVKSRNEPKRGFNHSGT